VVRRTKARRRLEGDATQLLSLSAKPCFKSRECLFAQKDRRRGFGVHLVPLGLQTSQRPSGKLVPTANSRAIVAKLSSPPTEMVLRWAPIEADHPVPQHLPIHSSDLRRLLPRSTVEHGCNRQQPTPLRAILRALRKPANLAGRMVRPHSNSLARGKHFRPVKPSGLQSITSHLSQAKGD
jgi:hypothetical protein